MFEIFPHFFVASLKQRIKKIKKENKKVDWKCWTLWNSFSLPCSSAPTTPLARRFLAAFRIILSSFFPFEDDSRQLNIIVKYLMHFGSTPISFLNNFLSSGLIRFRGIYSQNIAGVFFYFPFYVSSMVL